MTAHAIRTARVPARLSRLHGVRPALEQWLAGADLVRHGLPVQAIVLVRRMATGWAALSTSAWTPRYADLHAVLARAARPARGELLGDAVWFADEAELLACLARDALAGDLALRWWWTLVLRERSSPAAAARWLQAPQRVPAALAHMPAVQARAWLRSWTPALRQQLVQALAQHFPVAPEVVAAATAAAASIAQQPAAVVRPMRSDDPHARVHATRDAVEPVLGLALALARDPLAVIDPEAGMRVLFAASAGDATLAEERVAPDEMPVASGVPPPRPPVADEQHAAVVSGVPDVAALEPVSTPEPGQEVAHRSPQAPTAAPPGETSSLASSAPASPAATLATLPRLACATRIATQFGGVLFLLNAALEMGLYGDFTQPRRPGGLDVGPWRFLLACGRVGGGRAFADDSLAAWLRQRAAQPVPAKRVRRPGLGLSIRQRLLLALDLQEPHDIARLLLRLPAQLEDNGERVDLHLDLGSLPLAVRFAGLDRDPGWIPAAGCDVRFHFH